MYNNGWIFVHQHPWGGAVKFAMSCLLSLQIGPVVLKKKLLTGDGHSPIATGHLSYSGD